MRNADGFELEMNQLIHRHQTYMDQPTTPKQLLPLARCLADGRLHRNDNPMDFTLEFRITSDMLK
jgi:hypothetical protein